MLCDLIVVTPEAQEISVPATLQGSCDSLCCAVREMLGLKGAQTSALMLPSTVDCLFCQPRGCKPEIVRDRKMRMITCLRGP